MPFPEQMTTGSGGQAADYSMPPWMRFDPAERIRAGIQDAWRHPAVSKTDATPEEIQQQQQFQQQNAAQARKMAADAKFQQAIAGLNPSDPNYNQAYRSLMLQWAAESGQFTPGTAAMTRALTPAAPKPAPGFSLHPGEARFDSTGKPVANVPPLPPKPAPEFSLRPGEVRFGPTGEKIASVPPESATAPSSIPGIPVTGSDGKVIPGLVGTFNGKTIAVHNLPRERMPATDYDKMDYSALERRAASLHSTLDAFEENPTEQLKKDQKKAVTKDLADVEARMKAIRGGSANDKAKPNEVIRTTKDGKKAVFDATTHQFLRYAE